MSSRRQLLQTILAVQAAQNSAGYDLVMSGKGVTGDWGRRHEPDGRAGFRLDTSKSDERFSVARALRQRALCSSFTLRLLRQETTMGQLEGTVALVTRGDFMTCDVMLGDAGRLLG